MLAIAMILSLMQSDKRQDMLSPAQRFNVDINVTSFGCLDLLCALGPGALDDAVVDWEIDHLEDDQRHTAKQQDPPQSHLIMLHPLVAACKQVDEQEGLQQPSGVIENDAEEQQALGEHVGSSEASRYQAGIEHKLVDGNVVQNDIHLSAVCFTSLQISRDSMVAICCQ